MRVLITGAAETIGGFLRTRLSAPGRVLRLLDAKPLEGRDDEEVVQASVTDLAALRAACQDVDAVIHLAGISGETDWDRILAANIEGTYCAIEAARVAGVGRFVYASSSHAVGYHRRDPNGTPVPDYAFPAPDTYYGVSKVTGEALAGLYHHRYGMDTVCIRIGSCRERPGGAFGLANWLSPDDAGRLFNAAITAPSPGYRVVWGVSANTRNWFSLDEARTLGYRPQDNSELYAADILANDNAEGDPWAHRNKMAADLVGGGLTSNDFDADRLR